MLNYNIISHYTEKLNIFNYLEIIEKDQNIHMDIGFRGSIKENNKLDNSILFKVYCDIESPQNPIVLNWVGVFILQFDERPNINVDDLFNDKNIQNQLDDVMTMLSQNLIGDLPSFSQIAENKT